MTDPTTSPLTFVGDSTSAVCAADFCEILEHHEQAIVNRRLDDDRI